MRSKAKMQSRLAEFSSTQIDMERDITRRDFLNATLLASGGVLLNSVSPLGRSLGYPRY